MRAGQSLTTNLQLCADSTTAGVRSMTTMVIYGLLKYKKLQDYIQEDLRDSLVVQESTSKNV